MEIENLKTWTCEKYKVTMLADKAREFCARRFEISLDENSTLHNFDKCRTCDRGAIIAEIKNGGEVMATNKPCSTEGCGKTSQKDGLCYKCYKAKHGEVPYPSQNKETKSKVKKAVKTAQDPEKKTIKTRESRSVGTSRSAPAVLEVDLSTYPSLLNHIWTLLGMNSGRPRCR